MRSTVRKQWTGGVLVALAGLLPLQADDSRIQFNRDIRPILSDKCFACHGPDATKRKAKLRFDQRQGAFASLDGHFAIVAGKPEESVLYQRITAKDEDDRMPPVKSGRMLTPDQIAKLKRWIEEGAQWQEQWAFIPPVRSKIPEVKTQNWAHNAIDQFVLNRLEAEGLQPLPEAAKEVLIRRVTLDLTGLPPKPEEIDAFLDDHAPDAYERLVDGLLRAPQYGEQMARYWLDGARYGDTHGLHLDNERSLWPYRDWLIKAFRDNKPFDQFTVEQLAGDLLPQPTRDQLVATGFNRCNVTTSEGGAIPEEFAARYAVDRVETTSIVWMGLTTGCAVCHDHKFDPISQQEFYQLYAFFNSLDEDPMDGNALLPPPVVRLSTPLQEKKLAKITLNMDRVQQMVRAALTATEYRDPLTAEDVRQLSPREYVWVDDALPEGAKSSSGKEAWKFVSTGESPVFSGSKAHVGMAEKTGQHFFTDATDRLRVGKGDKLFTYVYLDPKQTPKSIMVQLNAEGWEHRAFWGEDLISMGETNTPGHRHLGPLPEAGKWVRLEVEAEKIGLAPGTTIHGWAFTQYGGTVYWDRAGIVSKAPQGSDGFDSLLAWDSFEREGDQPGLPEPVRLAIKAEPAKRTADQQKEIRDYFLQNVYAETKKLFDPFQQQLATLKKDRAELEAAIPQTMITKDLKEPRATFILERGAYDKKGEQVFPNVPAVLPPLPKDAPANRLALAEWLVDGRHPLTARVMVNRLWQQHFGIGLVKTSENFGSQGDPPSHPELLDWLATEFVASGWDIKHMQRLMVLSAAYRQSSKVRPDLLEKDPENRLLAHGPRFRLDAESIRDSVLAISGMLVEKVGGHGVKSYQPEGIWEAVAYPTSTTAKYKPDEGEALYRRSLYLFWKRTAPPPSMMIFDAPSRESCRVRRERTDTPLQSLALMNDTQYVEAARCFASKILHDGGTSLDQRIGFAFRRATGRFPDAREVQLLRDLYQSQFARYCDKPDQAKELIRVGAAKVDESVPADALAAWTVVANTILNLSETITND